MQALRNWQHRRKASSSPAADIPDVNGSVLDSTLISKGFFVGEDRVNCVVLLREWVTQSTLVSSILYGTNNGIFFQRLCGDLTGAPIKVLALKKINHLEILNHPELLVVSTNESVLVFPCNPTEGFEAITPDKGIDIGKPISLLKAGEALGREMLCLVRSQKLSSTVKMLEPTNDYEEPALKERQTKNKKLTFKAGNNRPGLKVFKEFYVASQCYSIHFLKTRLVLACASGFEVVDPETLDIQALLDPADLSLTFLKPLRDLRPIAIYRTESDFLLCYTHCAFHVDKGGWKLEDSPVMEWSGVSNSFAFDWPYLVICMSRHAEIRDVRDGKAVQVIQGDNFRRVFENNEPSKRSSGTLPKEGSPVVMISDSQVMLVQRGLPPRGLEAKARQGANTSSDT